MQGRHVQGEVLRNIRERRGLMRTELARRSRVSLSLIKLIELQGHQPSAPKAQLLADALGVNLDEFSTLDEQAA